ncbi:hypothetical protein Clacol_010259 [Clathrus columnatus]|uniref:Uncharacterized protein n=1 Tax=Clathrus columnatus TaxID=1419009 RepID=A0AAV5ATB8_9AGAM|nr:hypothetical protein Clacol_010259 [Clathrus columnatus]
MTRANGKHITCSPSQSSLKEKKARVSSGRGGSGNIISAMELTPDLKHEVELLRRRRMEKEDCTKYQKSADPDDSYEDIIVERNKLSPKPLRTGRGGSGGLLKPSPSQTTLRSPSRMSLSSGSSSSRHSTISFTSSSYSSPFSHRSESSIFTRFSKNTRDSTVSQSSITSSLPETGSSRKNHNQWWKFQRSPATTPRQPHAADIHIPQLTINDCPPLSPRVLEGFDGFEEEEGSTSPDIILPIPELQTSSFHLDETTDEEETPIDIQNDDEDAEWELDVLIQAQSEIETPFFAS